MKLRHTQKWAVAWVVIGSISSAPLQSSSGEEPGGLHNSSQAPPSEIWPILERAESALGGGDLPAAITLYREALELSPDHAPTLTNLGIALFQSNEVEPAVESLKAAVRAGFDDARAWISLGIVYFESQQWTAAHAALAQAVYLAPNDARAHHYLGLTFAAKGWSVAAEKCMVQAVTIDPQYRVAHFNLALAYLAREEPALELARRHYRRALDLGAEPDEFVERALQE
ncbi:MAG: tetratricopeptide repeat protein [Verrucomicrobiales bacterium]